MGGGGGLPRLGFAPPMRRPRRCSRASWPSTSSPAMSFELPFNESAGQKKLQKLLDRAGRQRTRVTRVGPHRRELGCGPLCCIARCGPIPIPIFICYL